MVDDSLDVRERILRAATALLHEGGREAVSTRAVAAAAGVQAPTLYRQFGDMQGLLHAVAGEMLAAYVQQKRVLEDTEDAIADLRRGWEHHVAFALANPSAYLLIYGEWNHLGQSPALREAEAILHALVARVAQSGRLRVSVPHAVRMVSAACRGVALSLIGTIESERDDRLSHDTREAVLTAITVDPDATSDQRADRGTNQVVARAVALRASLDSAADALSPAEVQLMREWLDRLSSAN